MVALILIYWPLFLVWMGVGMAVTAVAAFLLGRVNPAAILSRCIKHTDLTRQGNGRADLANLRQFLGTGPTLAALFLEALTAALAMTLFLWFAAADPGYIPLPGFDASPGYVPFLGFETDPGPSFLPLGNIEYAITAFGKYWVAMFCLAGRDFRIKGEKGMVTLGVAALVIDWRIALVVWGGFFLLTALTRCADIGALWAGTAFPLLTWYYFPEPLVVILSLLCASQMIRPYLHRVRELIGTEANR